MMESNIHQSKQGFCHRLLILQATWEATKLFILNNSYQSQCTLLASSFLCWVNQDADKHWQFLEPTEEVLSKLGVRVKAPTLLKQMAQKKDKKVLAIISDTAIFNLLKGTESQYFKITNS